MIHSKHESPISPKLDQRAWYSSKIYKRWIITHFSFILRIYHLHLLFQFRFIIVEENEFSSIKWHRYDKYIAQNSNVYIKTSSKQFISSYQSLIAQLKHFRVVYNCERIFLSKKQYIYEKRDFFLFSHPRTKYLSLTFIMHFKLTLKNVVMFERKSFSLFFRWRC